jgi:hypothetical protein
LTNVNGIIGALSSHRSDTTIASNAVWEKSGIRSSYHELYENEDNYFLSLIDEGNNTYRFRGVSFDDADYTVGADYFYYIDISGDFWGFIDISPIVDALAKGVVSVTETMWNQCGDGPVLWGILNVSPDVPSSPSPSDGSIDNSVNVTLSWQGTDLFLEETETYDVYLSEEYFWDPYPRSYDQSDTSYSYPFSLPYGTTFNWRIVTHGNGREVEGPVWSFTTFSASGDADNDGLTNEQEITLDTNPFNPDTDEDGLNDGEEVNAGSNPRDPDSDDDGIGDLEDNCRIIANADQANFDEDEYGDVCDADDDGDGVTDADDNCILVHNPDQANADYDLLGDACDSTFNTESVTDALEDEAGSCVETIALVNPPGGSGMVTKLIGKNGAAIRVADTVQSYEAGEIDATTYIDKLNGALGKLDGFDAQLDDKISSGQLVDPEASELLAASAEMRTMINNLIEDAS